MTSTPLIKNISSPLAARNEYTQLFKRNKGRGSWSKYIYLKVGANRKYGIYVSASKPQGKGIIKVNKL